MIPFVRWVAILVSVARVVFSSSAQGSSGDSAGTNQAPPNVWNRHMPSLGMPRRWCGRRFWTGSSRTGDGKDCIVENVPQHNNTTGRMGQPAGARILLCPS